MFVLSNMEEALPSILQERILMGRQERYERQHQQQ